MDSDKFRRIFIINICCPPPSCEHYSTPEALRLETDLYTSPPR